MNSKLMESNNQQPSQSQGQGKKSTAAIIGILVGIVAVLFVVNALMKRDKPVDNGNRNVVSGNVNSSTDEDVSTKPKPLNIEEILSDSTIDISDWPTFTNTKYWWSIKRYPNGFWNPDQTDATEYTSRQPEYYISKDVLNLDMFVLRVFVDDEEPIASLDEIKNTDIPKKLDHQPKFQDIVIDGMRWVVLDNRYFMTSNGENLVTITIPLEIPYPLRYQFVKSAFSFRFLDNR